MTNTNTDICQICLENNINIINFKHHECNFKTHEKCICEWLMKTEKCPICRSQLNINHFALYENMYILSINDYSFENNNYDITYPFNKRPTNINLERINENTDINRNRTHYLMRFRFTYQTICTNIALYSIFIFACCCYYTITNVYSFLKSYNIV